MVEHGALREQPNPVVRVQTAPDPAPVPTPRKGGRDARLTDRHGIAISFVFSSFACSKVARGFIA